MSGAGDEETVYAAVPSSPESAATLGEGVPRSLSQADSAGTGAPSGSRSRSTEGGARGTSATSFGPTPTETLRYEEIYRTRVFLAIAVVMAVVFTLSTFVLPADPQAKSVLFSGMFAIVSACGWMLWKIREDAGYTERRVLVASHACVYGALTGVYFFGPFSPAPVIIPFGLFFFSLAQSAAGTLSAYLLCAGGQLVLSVGVMTGWMHDRGVMHTLAPQVQQGVIVALVEGVYLATFVIGRASRRATLRALEQHDRVVRSLAQREALLLEARRELDRALQSGGVGRYTDQVLGCFRLGTILGRGAMGEVYEAVHTETHVPAAVKVLQTEMLRHPDSIRRFIREAQMAAAIESPHVVRVLEIGGLESLLPYIAMERLEGTDLSERLRHRSRLSPLRVVRMAREVARGLEAARLAGIVHRDLKPANLFLSKQADGKERWKILDFGVSKLMGSMGATLTKENAIVGTPEYMAPEQPLGREVSHRTDVYSLGVICYRVLTGRPAFTGEALMDTIYAVVNRMPPRPTEVLPSLPVEIDAVLAIAMAKAPEDRFESALLLAEALAGACKGALSPELSSCAERVLAETPWGTEGQAPEPQR